MVAWVQCKHRLSVEEDNWVKAKAKKEQTSRNYIVRYLIKEAMEKEENEKNKRDN